MSIKVTLYLLAMVIASTYARSPNMGIFKLPDFMYTDIDSEEDEPTTTTTLDPIEEKRLALETNEIIPGRGPAIQLDPVTPEELAPEVSTPEVFTPEVVAPRVHSHEVDPPAPDNGYHEVVDPVVDFNSGLPWSGPMSESESDEEYQNDQTASEQPSTTTSTTSTTSTTEQAKFINQNKAPSTTFEYVMDFFYGLSQWLYKTFVA